MSTKVTVNSVPTTRVSINGQQRETIRTVGVAPSSITNQLASLTDVDATSSDNNDVLVYDSTVNKYVVKELPIIDGGTF